MTKYTGGEEAGVHGLVMKTLCRRQTFFDCCVTVVSKKPPPNCPEHYFYLLIVSTDTRTLKDLNSATSVSLSETGYFESIPSYLL